MKEKGRNVKKSEIYLIEIHSGHDFLSASALGQMYGCSSQTIRRHFDEMEKYPRYAKAWLKLNESGKPLYNVLAYLDYLRYGSMLKERNIAKHLPEFSEAEVRARRGDYVVIKNEG